MNSNQSSMGWDAPTTLKSTTVTAHWIGFIALFVCTVVLAINTWHSKGPRGTEKFYAGYHEQNCIFIFVCLFATVSYFSKIVADSAGQNFSNTGPLLFGLGNYRYADQTITAPLIVLDLMCQLRAPYRISSTVLVYAELLFSLMTQFYPESSTSLYMWFCGGYFLKGLGNWFQFIIVIGQYNRLRALANSIGAGKSLYLLKITIFTFFSAWAFYPLIWIMGKEGLVTATGEECMSCFIDITVKLVYGISLMLFRRSFDKKMFTLLDRLGLDSGERNITSESLQQCLRGVSITEKERLIRQLRARLECFSSRPGTSNEASIQKSERPPRARRREPKVTPTSLLPTAAIEPPFATCEMKVDVASDYSPKC